VSIARRAAKDRDYSRVLLAISTRHRLESPKLCHYVAAVAPCFRYRARPSDLRHLAAISDANPVSLAYDQSLLSCFPRNFGTIVIPFLFCFLFCFLFFSLLLFINYSLDRRGVLQRRVARS